MVQLPLAGPRVRGDARPDSVRRLARPQPVLLLACFTTAASVASALWSRAPQGVFVPCHAASGFCDAVPKNHDAVLRPQPTRAENRVALGAHRKMSKKVKLAKNIVALTKQQARAWSSKPLKKEMKRIKKIQEDDSWANEFMSYARPMPVGGEYVMPVSTAMDILTEIYGDGPSMQNFGDRRGSSEDEEVDFDAMENMRRQADPSKNPGPRARKSPLGVGHMPGISKYIGSLPREVMTNRIGKLGIQGGSQSDSYQDVWISGSSVSYDFDEGDHDYRR